MMTASSPLIIKPVGVTTGGRPFFGNTPKLRPSKARSDLFGAEFPVTRSSRSEIQLTSATTRPSKLDAPPAANVFQSSPDKLEAVEEGLEKVIYRFRFLAILGVFGSLIGSLLCFIKGCTYVASSFMEYFVNQGKVVLLLVEAIDVYLLGTVMLVFGMGLYELFVSNLSIVDSVLKENVHRSNLFGLFTLKERPRWLEIKTVSELKTKVGHVIVMLLLIGLLDKSKKAVIGPFFIFLIISAGVRKDDNIFRVKLINKQLQEVVLSLPFVGIILSLAFLSSIYFINIKWT